jgi:hypothetical protein
VLRTKPFPSLTHVRSCAGDACPDTCREAFRCNRSRNQPSLFEGEQALYAILGAWRMFTIKTPGVTI